MGEARRRKLAEASQIEDLDATQSSAWPLANASVQTQLEKKFSRLGIDFSKPGFHDSQPFLLAEARDPVFIESYARYVEARSYTDQDLADAQRKVAIAADVVTQAVQADGRHGLCVVASGVLSRILDELGVWNFCAKATLTVTFPPTVSEERRYFYALDHGEFTAPHAIVVAPPFVAVDTTVRAQTYDSSAMGEALPALVMQQQFTPFKWSDEDIAAPHARMLLKAAGSSVQRYLEKQNSQMLRMMKAFPARRADYPGGSLDYVIIGVGGYAEKLADLAELTHIAGTSASRLFSEQVLPRLKS
ncbi:hypothetical protein [Achromobacter xylosoxidans]|uniref:hypothetical protein n=1 Tax=Alcaligenes xylosoxydans xylosoxydans TaxID=85698 RepID=UPI00192B3463|nr:hypothetical protein [Achromobacter xylosoxidans]